MKSIPVGGSDLAQFLLKTRDRDLLAVHGGEHGLSEGFDHKQVGRAVATGDRRCQNQNGNLLFFLHAMSF
jgi:hypothetical protein